ncbi:MAG: hypothetical protein GXX96_20735 [Planctomycetaceae bacterium]|nr:hypothetical protein [Planctomycetaceae bacterium]
MSRRKKRNTHRPETQPEPARTTPEPNPPRPNPPLLVFAIVLAVLWMGALVVMAVFT